MRRKRRHVAVWFYDWGIEVFVAAVTVTLVSTWLWRWLYFWA